ncbi:MAG: hypothetical protein ABJK64_04350 [Paraglaciecola sp.]|uniref:hypothetical protein n=1 Tax=Paraglaciecola sp. TaxID=1920173 RepID=UPI0032978438
MNQQGQTIRDTSANTVNLLVDRMQLNGHLKQCVLMVGDGAISRALNGKSLVTE